MNTELSKPRPRPLASLMASAKRLTAKTLGNRSGAVSRSWQADAWDMFDLVGEHRFLAVTLAGRMSQARFYVGKLAEDPNEDPVPVEDPKLTAVLEAIGSSAAARAQLIARLGVNLFVAGDGWLAGIPRHLMPASMMVGNSLTIDPGLQAPEPLSDSLSIEELEWRMLSISEVSTNAGGQVQIQLGEGETEKLQLNPDDVLLIRVWRPHPRKWWEADSPTRSSLPVLRELVGLTMHISAQVDSRLAGAGLLLVPQTAQRAMQVAAGQTEEEGDDFFTESLMEAMLTPIADRASASALVPLVATVPDETTEKFRYMSFDKPLDTEARPMRDESIRRLALGLDAPPELLLGTGGMNHWGAWLVLEDVVTTHLEPPLALICDALTTQYLWPVLGDQGMSPEEAHDYVIWYDVSDLVVRPNRGADAQALHDKGVISDEALRGATGFDETDAPPALPLELELALDAVKANPALLAAPGLANLVAQIRQALAGEVPDDAPAIGQPAIAAEPAAEGDNAPGTLPAAVPQTSNEPAAPAGPDAIAASAVGTQGAVTRLTIDGVEYTGHSLVSAPMPLGAKPLPKPTQPIQLAHQPAVRQRR